MIYGPRILNLWLCSMKSRVIRYTRLALLILVLHSQIVREGSAYSSTSFLKDCASKNVDTQLFRKYQDLR